MSIDQLHLASAQQVVAMLKAGQVTPLQLIDIAEVRVLELIHTSTYNNCLYLLLSSVQFNAPL